MKGTKFYTDIKGRTRGPMGATPSRVEKKAEKEYGEQNIAEGKLATGEMYGYGETQEFNPLPYVAERELTHPEEPYEYTDPMDAPATYRVVQRSQEHAPWFKEIPVTTSESEYIDLRPGVTRPYYVGPSGMSDEAVDEKLYPAGEEAARKKKEAALPSETTSMGISRPVLREVHRKPKEAVSDETFMMEHAQELPGGRMEVAGRNMSADEWADFERYMASHKADRFTKEDIDDYFNFYQPAEYERPLPKHIY